MRCFIAIFIAITFFTSIGSSAFGQANHWKDLQSLTFPENYPTKETADRLYDEMLFHRATQVVLWSLPAMTLWAALIVFFVGLGLATFYIGLALTLPLLGHATWHAYRDLIPPEA